MRITFDQSAFSISGYHGFGRYYSEIIDTLNRKEGIECKIPIRYVENENIKEYYSRNNKTFRIFPIRSSFKGKSKIIERINRQAVKKALKADVSDIFHVTQDTLYFSKYLNGTPMIITVFDMIPELFSDSYYNDRYSQERIAIRKKLAYRSKRIIVSTENTKTDLLKFYPDINEAKIDVIFLGCNMPDPDFTYLEKHQVPEQFILFVGNRWRYKNGDLFWRAVSPLVKEDMDLHVVLAGGKPLSTEENEYIISSGIEDKIRHYHPDDKGLSALYSRAQVLVYPTLYEGFGLPVPEAFSMGCPVIVSNVSCLPEVAGDAAVYFNPSDSKDLQDAVRSVVYDPKKRKELKNLGKKRVKVFSWEKTAELTLDTYKKALQY